MSIFGVDPLGVLSGLLVAGLIGWTYTLYKYHQALVEMERAQFWWEWWAETAVRHNVDIGEDDIEAADELQPEGGPSIWDQIHAVSPDEDAREFIEALEAAGVELDRPEADD